MSSDGLKILIDNKKARFNYFVEDSWECGIVLVGSEVKSMKLNQFSFPDAFGEIEKDEVFLLGLHINKYKMGSWSNPDPDRKKKLLLHKAEIQKIKRKVREKGYTLIPLKFYLKNGRVKCELGLCRGKKNYDKRDSIKEKDLDRDLKREQK